MMYLIVINTILIIILILVVLTRNNNRQEHQLKSELLQRFLSLEMDVKDEFQRNRLETAAAHQRSRTELNDTLRISLEQFAKTFDRSVQSFNELQKEKFNRIETRQNDLILHTENKLEFIRTIVEEKLERTLSERLKQSFASVSTQLTEVQKGLGEMQVLAGDVGGLKRVLSNVKMRGGFGEVQLSMLLEQLLSPDQYEANVKTRERSAAHVEFAIKLPGKSDGQKFVWLPVDAKFPKEVFEKVQDAYDRNDVQETDTARRALFNTIRKMSADINDKYIDPPNTTDFAILFLPFEAIYAEVIRHAGLLEEIQRDFRVVITGPATLGAILNSLQMGFRTLAIQKRSSEVWQVLSEVKTEFEKFSGLLGKAQTNIQTGLNQLDDVLGRRTRSIQRKLKAVESVKPADLPKPPDETEAPEYPEED